MVEVRPILTGSVDHHLETDRKCSETECNPFRCLPQLTADGYIQASTLSSITYTFNYGN